MRLTRFGFHGAVFYVLMVSAFYASPYSNLFFLLLGFLTLLWLTGITAAIRNLRGVRATTEEPAPAPSGQDIHVTIQIDGGTKYRFQIAACMRLEDGQTLDGQLDFVDGTGTLTLHSPGLARGCHRVARVEVGSSHPFGIIRLRRNLTPPTELVVYPAPIGLMEGRSAHDDLDELLGMPDPGAGDLQPSGLRDHREEEGIRGIHWRASARRGHLVVQEWEGGRGEGLEVSLDRRCSAEELEEALGTISALVHLARTNKESLRIHSQELSATFGSGHRPWSEALRFLAAAQMLPSDAQGPPATSPNVTRLPRPREAVATR